MEMEAKNQSSRTDLISELPELIETAAQMTILSGNHTETNTKQRQCKLTFHFALHKLSLKQQKFPPFIANSYLKDDWLRIISLKI